MAVLDTSVSPVVAYIGVENDGPDYVLAEMTVTDLAPNARRYQRSRARGRSIREH